jgi:biopolymer transport protein ExbD
VSFGTSRARRYDLGPNMTPLVDVVLILLIFVMLAGG